METRNFYYDRNYVVILFVACSTIILMALLYLVLAGYNRFTICVITLMMYPIIQFPKILKCFVRLVLNRPALTLSDQYIMIGQLGYKIKWGDIEHFKKKHIVKSVLVINEQFIAFDLYEPLEYINQIKNPVSRLLTRIQLNFFDGPFCLGLDVIDAEDKEILDDIREYFRHYARQPMLEI